MSWLVQVFSSQALDVGSVGYWLLVVFVGGVIGLSILFMVLLVIFETYRAVKYSHLYQKLT
jgi:hypothetical protein